jgi:rare lipoprotein A
MTRLNHRMFRGRTVRYARIFILLFVLGFFLGCNHPKQAHVEVPPPPPPHEDLPPSSTAKTHANSTAPVKPKEASDAANVEPESFEPTLPANAKPILTETGLASWYGPPYHNRRGSNGEVYNMHAMTAAHRTLPLGSIVRVTNVKTGNAAFVRITDRGPFIPGRVLDLSLAAARKLDVYTPGVAQVRVEVMETPAPLDSGGKWAVQIGGFPHEGEAHKLSGHLERRYRTSKVLCFKSPAGDWWIRIRVLDDDHDRAQKLVAETETPEGAVFLVRLD